MRKDNWGADLEMVLETQEQNNQRKNDDVTLEEAIAKRELKITMVNEKLLRQEDHIHKVRKNMEQNRSHIKRWERQNDRDRKALEVQKNHPSVTSN